MTKFLLQLYAAGVIATFFASLFVMSFSEGALSHRLIAVVITAITWPLHIGAVALYSFVSESVKELNNRG